VRTGRWLDVVRATGGPHTGLAMATATRHRSAGTADFLQGRWLEHAPDEAPPQWPAQARACALAGRLDGAEDDGLVDVASALGRGLSPGQALPGGEPGRCVVDRVGHAALPHDEAVLAQVRRWMAE
jgi:hypothetical protein